MKIRKLKAGLVLPLGLAVLLTGCAAPMNHGANYEPIVDVRANQQAQYSTDLAECQAYANRVMSASQGAAAGAIAGAILGAALGAAVGGNSRFNAQMAGLGAVSGGVGGAVEAEGGQRGIISRCLAGRGYSVLN